LNARNDTPNASKKRCRQIVAAPTVNLDGDKIYVDHIQQSHLGADLHVLVRGSGVVMARESH
jgi:hypothetical protein